MKLKMPTKKVYHISETRGLLKTINSVLQKITDPIQPKVAEHRPQTTKRLSYPFSREKQHLFDLTDRDSFFDSKTRSTIVSRRPGIASSEGAPGDPSDHFISLKLLRVEASSNCL